MLYTPIRLPGAAPARPRPFDPPHLAERRRERLLRLVARQERRDIEATVEGLIALLDERDGDPDLEDSHDREEATLPIGAQQTSIGTYIDLRDDYEADAEQDGDPSWLEWSDGKSECNRSYQRAGAGGEDDEAAGDELDGNRSEDDFMFHHLDGPGCPIADGIDTAWPEATYQPPNMLGGLAGQPDEDAEPWLVPPHWQARPVPANDTVPA